MRAVIDVNVLISGLFWQGAPHTLLERVRDGTLRFVSSPVLLAELAEVLERPRFSEILKRSNTSLERSMAEIQTLAEVIAAPPLQVPVCRDPDDDAVLALAVAAHVDMIISGDRDLIELGSHRRIPIVTPAEALARIGEQSH